MHARPIVSLTATAVATLALAACGGSGSATKTTTSTAATSTTAATTSPAADTSTASPVATTDSASPTTGTDGPGSTQGTTGSGDASSSSATPTSASSGSGHGSVQGASGSLATYLSSQAAKATKDNGCRMTISVGKRVGSYARGSYFGKGCGGWAATWAKVGGSWQEVYAGQEAPDCSVFDAKSPKMPASLGQQCVKDGKAVTYGASGSGSGDQAGGVVHGGSADLKTFLQGRLTELNKGQSCKYYAEVDKQVGSYASGGFSGCGGAAGFWARSGGAWHTVAETQDVIQCPDLQSKAPGMPTSLVKECYDPKEHVVVPWKPAA